MPFDRHYAHTMLEVLQYDLKHDINHLDADGFWQRISRIAQGAAGQPSVSVLSADPELTLKRLEAAEAKIHALGDLVPTDYDGREELLGAVLRIIHPQTFP